ncbi:MAG: hypothetical protein KF800_17315 [Lysobacter sp.]|nr:hypothetical protein [Lysobacter sp.]
MHARSPQSPQSADLPFPGYAPLDIAPDTFAHDQRDDGAFPSALSWSADDLAEAVRLPLHEEVFAPSANDARLHRPRRTLRFLAAPPLTARFRIGG